MKIGIDFSIHGIFQLIKQLLNKRVTSSGAYRITSSGKYRGTI